MSSNRSVKDKDVLNGLISLQEAVTIQLNDLNSKFDQLRHEMECRFDLTNNKIDTLEHRVLRRFDDLDERLDAHETRITALESRS
jgi:hypothetical protein